MKQYDDYYNEFALVKKKWGLQGIPFSESASAFQQDKLDVVFTGRHEEIKDVLFLLSGQERKRFYIYGWVGIGKTAFILQVLNILKQKSKDTLTAYISLPQESDLPTAAMIALAKEMVDDEWAQEHLYTMGLTTPKRPVSKEGRLMASALAIEGERVEKTIPVGKPAFPSLSFNDLLSRALTKYKRVVIAIDDLDKQDPARVRELLRNAQGMLKGGASFLITGHPSGITRDILARDLGLFDLAIELKPLNEETMFEMLVNYLNSARIKSIAPSDPLSVKPFLQDSAIALCKKSNGVPRWLNRLGSYVLLKAASIKAEEIDAKVLTLGFEYADKQLRGQIGLLPEDYYILDLVLRKGNISDENISISDLEQIKLREFSELLPFLERLSQLDLLQRLPSEHACTFGPSPLLCK